jgi:hypothetical protein
MTTATITWTDPVYTGEFSVKVFDSVSPTTELGIVAKGVQTFTTGPLTAGPHTFSTVVSDSTGNASVPNISASVTIGLPPTTGIDVKVSL